MAENRSRRWMVRGGECLVVLAVAAALVLFTIRVARRSARLAERAQNMKSIGLGLHNFADAYQVLPPAVRTDSDGQPLCSWRFQIVVFIEAIMKDLQYGKRWDDPANQSLLAAPFHAYCWSSESEISDRLHTNVVAVTGPGTAFDGDRAVRLCEIDPDTILAIEIADSGTHWMEPGDLNVDEVPASIVQGMDGDGVHVLFADGFVWFIRSEVPLEDLKKFFTIAGAKQYDRDQVLDAYADRDR